MRDYRMCENVKVNKAWLGGEQRRERKAGAGVDADDDGDDDVEDAGEDWSGNGGTKAPKRKVEARYEYGCMLCVVM